MSKNEEIYTAGKNFTLPQAVTGVTNIISAYQSDAKFNQITSLVRTLARIVCALCSLIQRGQKHKQATVFFLKPQNCIFDA